MGQLPYDERELLGASGRFTYEGAHLDRVAFPLGGIGAGCIGLSGTGKLIDWEIFNNPNKGFQPRFSFLSVWARQDGRDPLFKVLEGQLRERLDGPLYVADGMFREGNGVGPQQTQAAGLPRMRSCRFEGRFPFATVALEDHHFPITAAVEGWSPFIPGNDRDSSLPVAILTVRLHNPTGNVVEVGLGINVQNCTGTRTSTGPGQDTPRAAGADPDQAGFRNELMEEQGATMLYMHQGDGAENSMFIATTASVDSWQLHWPGQHNFMALEHFARTFGATGHFEQSRRRGVDAASARDEPRVSDKRVHSHDRHWRENGKVGSLGFHTTLQPGETFSVPLVIGWYFPVFDTARPNEIGRGEVPTWRNYYGVQWGSGLEVARYVTANLQRLEAGTRLFQSSFFASTLPATVLEAVSSNLAILRSPTLIRYPDGTLYGWEGCAPSNRLGHGTCNHVWNYQHAIPFLFPALQRSMLENAYASGMRESDGAIAFRVPAGPGNRPEQFRAAADGQLGMVCQAYREWLIGGDTAWLRKIWPSVKKSLEYAWEGWDADRDGLLEGSHHNTLDLDFSTPETMCGSQYQAALLAGERMALLMGDEPAAQTYRRLYESGKWLTEDRLFNGEYYHQMLPAPEDYQLADGCISEQVHGQLYARMLGLDDIYDREHIRTALRSLFRYNFRDDFYDHVNTARAYAVGGDRGLLIATWPRGGRPEQPLLYCDETQAGYEYQVAINLLYEGMVLEGLTVIKAVRDRYDGARRNPYCEFEWGNHYARSMATYAALPALARFRYVGAEGLIGIDPQLAAEDFRIFFSVEGAWGTIAQRVEREQAHYTVDVAMGDLAVSTLSFGLQDGDARPVASLGERAVGARRSIESGAMIITLSTAVTVRPGKPLRVRVG